MVKGSVIYPLCCCSMCSCYIGIVSSLVPVCPEQLLDNKFWRISPSGIFAGDTPPGYLPETLLRDICRSNHLPESRNPGNSGISEKLDFDLFVGEQGGMKISTAVSTLFRGLAEAVRGCSYCSGIIMLRDNIAPG